MARAAAAAAWAALAWATTSSPGAHASAVTPPPASTTSVSGTYLHYATDFVDYRSTCDNNGNFMWNLPAMLQGSELHQGPCVYAAGDVITITAPVGTHVHIVHSLGSNSSDMAALEALLPESDGWKSIDVNMQGWATPGFGHRVRSNVMTQEIVTVLLPAAAAMTIATRPAADVPRFAVGDPVRLATVTRSGDLCSDGSDDLFVATGLVCGIDPCSGEVNVSWGSIRNEGNSGRSTIAVCADCPIDGCTWPRLSTPKDSWYDSWLGTCGVAAQSWLPKLPDRFWPSQLERACYYHVSWQSGSSTGVASHVGEDAAYVSMDASGTVVYLGHRSFRWDYGCASTSMDLPTHIFLAAQQCELDINQGVNVLQSSGGTYIGSATCCNQSVVTTNVYQVCQMAYPPTLVCTPSTNAATTTAGKLVVTATSSTTTGTTTASTTRSSTMTTSTSTTTSTVTTSMTVTDTSSTSTTMSNTATRSATTSTVTTSATRSSTTTTSVTTTTSTSSTTVTSTSSTSTTMPKTATHRISTTKVITSTPRSSTAATSVTTTTSSSSATSSATSSRSSTSTSSTALDTAKSSIDLMLESLAHQEEALLSSLQGNAGVDSSAVVIGDTTMVAQRLRPSSGETVVAVQGTDVNVTVPATVLSSLGGEEAAVVVSVFSPSDAQDMSSEVEVKAAVNIDIFSLATIARLHVGGLSEPILFVLPANRSLGMRCAFWDAASASWSEEGLYEASSEEGGPMVCATSHLSLFGAIWRGIATSIECSQLFLLNADSMREVFRGDWYLSMGAAVLWAILATLLGLFLAACLLDCRMGRRRGFHDECFLIALDQYPELACAEEEEEEPPPAQKEEPESRAKRAAAACCCCVAACLETSWQWCKESSAVRDALDDILSNWLARFSEVRDFLEGLWEGLACCEHEVEEGMEGGRTFRAFHSVMSSLVVSSTCRQATASLWLSHELVSFVLQDEDLNQILLSRRSPGAAAQDGERRRRRKEAWLELHDCVTDSVNAHWERSASWCSVPCVVMKLFVARNPFGGVLLGCQFWSCRLRVLFFACEILGSLLLGTVFFQASGAVGSKRSRGNCTSSDPREQIGRLLVIGAGSLLFACVPVILLESLHSRSFKKFEHEGCPEWRRQLRVWWIQDAMLWFFGILYLCFCTSFIVLFLANVAAEDHPSWAVAGLISIVEDVLIIPLAVALFVPFLAASFLQLTAWAMKLDKVELLRQRRAELAQRGNWDIALVNI